jgi:hypothetical protein
MTASAVITPSDIAKEEIQDRNHFEAPYSWARQARKKSIDIEREPVVKNQRPQAGRRSQSKRRAPKKKGS